MSDLPTFHTRRLVVRPRVMADLHACLVMDRDPEVTRFVAGPWNDPERHAAFVRERITADFGVGLGYWSVCDRYEPHRFLGWVLLIPYDGNGPDIEIGWRFVRRAWGRGYATEAALPIVAHAFGTLGLGRIVAGIEPGNDGSMNVARKIGMRRSGQEAGGEALFVMSRADHERTSGRRGIERHEVF
ncbi:GNAT family N-acetyltransferase [Gluconacetobacter sp. Hr-1-5]|uniref:GNAT family N-acetyltransferase n=1 Tax=Gluconacetobacter sp. Hr-1-5 TaxID=3395370 RepID=UPI003B51CC28